MKQSINNYRFTNNLKLLVFFSFFIILFSTSCSSESENRNSANAVSKQNDSGSDSDTNKKISDIHEKIEDLASKINETKAQVNQQAETSKNAHSMALKAKQTADEANSKVEKTNSNLKRTVEYAKAVKKDTNQKIKDLKNQTDNAEATANQANTKSDQAKVTSKQANTKSDQAKATSKQANTKSDQAKATSKQADNKSNEAKATSKQADNKSNQATVTSQQAKDKTDMHEKKIEDIKQTVQTKTTTAGAPGEDFVKKCGNEELRVNINPSLFLPHPNNKKNKEDLNDILGNLLINAKKNKQKEVPTKFKTFYLSVQFSKVNKKTLKNSCVPNIILDSLHIKYFNKAKAQIRNTKDNTLNIKSTVGVQAGANTQPVEKVQKPKFTGQVKINTDTELVICPSKNTDKYKWKGSPCNTIKAKNSKSPQYLEFGIDIKPIRVYNALTELAKTDDQAKELKKRVDASKPKRWGKSDTQKAIMDYLKKDENSDLAYKIFEEIFKNATLESTIMWDGKPMKCTSKITGFDDSNKSFNMTNFTT